MLQTHVFKYFKSLNIVNSLGVCEPESLLCNLKTVFPPLSKKISVIKNLTHHTK